ncbi:hypothetical protein M8C21_013860 [Ambrosia artemisiifolia]|uniref:Uncharacterized protein n=1 Tax=Ambrosia artemisiifolia TaxID=4212 RepID=A0AAD5CF65_AMBAR|nr:hypothetical protein M8C21_013860 [Ambrosia artemisiifolia]
MREGGDRHAGEIRLIIEYTSANKPANIQTLPYGAPQGSLYPLVSSPPPLSVAPYPPAGGYPAPSPYPSYPPNLGAYQPSPYPPQGTYYAQPYPPNPAYPSQQYVSQHPSCPPYPGTYPPLY